jgi:LytS/YehU family sensor histidine kinase
VLNHEELLTEIAKALAKIANMLPRADLSSNLYPTQRMRVAVAQLYTKVLHFIQDAVKWYKKGKLAHSVSAVFKPYSLGFKAIVDGISEASRRVDQEASAASRAEIRELHIKIHQLSQLSIGSSPHFLKNSWN